MADEEQTKGLITLNQASRLLDISEERIRQLMKEGYIERGPRAHVLLVSAVQGYIKSLRDDIKRIQQTGTGTESRVRDLRAQEIAQRIAMRDGTLIRLDRAVGLVDSIAGVLRSEFEGLPASATRDRHLRNVLQDRIDGAFARASKRLEEFSKTGEIAEQ